MKDLINNCVKVIMKDLGILGNCTLHRFLSLEFLGIPRNAQESYSRCS